LNVDSALLRTEDQVSVSSGRQRIANDEKGNGSVHGSFEDLVRPLLDHGPVCFDDLLSVELFLTEGVCANTVM
jgi:hypothetical protein